MNVPNHEKKPFRDMTPEERSAIVDSTLRGDTEWLDVDEWRKSASNFMVLDAIYRTKPRQLIIPWEVIKPEYKWAAMNENDEVRFYIEKPIYRSNHYWNGACVTSPLNIDTTGIDWRESLVRRPDGV